MDYKISSSSNAYLHGLFSQFKDDGQDWIYSPSFSDGSASFSHVTRKPSQWLFSATARRKT